MKNSHLGIYKTLSATTNPTVTNKFVAGRKGKNSRVNPKTIEECL